MRKLLLTCWLLAWIALAAPARADDGLVPVPPLSAHVIDQVHLLQPQQRQALEGVLAEIEQRTGSQIGVLLMSSTAPEAIEQYSIRVADAWKLGRKGVDDGVILIVAKDNPKSLRRLRIEAGRGVQGSLTDAQSKRILEDVIAPHFRQNDFYGGLAAGVTAITTLLEQEKLPPAKRSSGAVQTDDGGGWITLMVIGLFLVVFFTVLLKSRRSSRNALNSNDWGRGGSTTAGVIIGSLVDEALRQASSGRGGSRSGGGGFGGGFGGSSGGGFSGGGGTFDGGGASGDW
ncbi:TPM domain-containing protein [Herbaspirillum huttiense]|uniref:TPM domain-containing protein n=3 Tax=Pseudomonadota TaxID=1224 RepID=A0AAJ2H794_9BURK|nr:MULTISPECIES: TPM domain-containing protein [Herbaspirillum]MDR9838104.1 TPM domain-containing protein [Herbaspirillum huttiense]UWE14999.1 TPM domain-containing protein [Herbaspirillum huttiense]